jgi:hypothetical protein
VELRSEVHPGEGRLERQILIYSPEFKSVFIARTKSPQPETGRIGIEAYSGTHGSADLILVVDCLHQRSVLEAND